MRRRYVAREYEISDPHGFEGGYNLFLQAELSQAQTNINVVLGLCSDHNMLFTINLGGSVPILIVKDRTLVHNYVTTGVHLNPRRSGNSGCFEESQRVD